jgi:hypothetical protein
MTDVAWAHSRSYAKGYLSARRVDKLAPMLKAKAVVKFIDRFAYEPARVEIVRWGGGVFDPRERIAAKAFY